MWMLEPLSGRHAKEAVRFLLGGDRRNSAVALRAEAFYEAARQSGAGHPCIWRARQGRATVASAMIVRRPGRIGLLFFSPPQLPGVEAAALTALLQQAARAALREGLCLVQSLLRPEEAHLHDLMVTAGFTRLAELLYMERKLANPAPPAPLPLELRSRGRFSDEELTAVIASSYQDSLDCPALCGLRTVADAIASHEATGVYRPAWWWIFSLDRRDAGCLLLCDTSESQSTELVYMGVHPEFRGRGLGRSMLRHAISVAHGSGRSSLKLAVDLQNSPARRLYESEGFLVTDRRAAYVAAETPGPGKGPAPGPC